MVKTTAAKAMLDELGLTYMFVNGSEESGIDVLRTKIKNFASTVSLHGGRKYLILDEADYLNPQSTQPALRGFIEEFHKNCGFILTCNYKNRLYHHYILVVVWWILQFQSQRRKNWLNNSSNGL